MDFISVWFSVYICFFAFDEYFCFLRTRGVGFLRYFQVKQLPNFLLASPMLSLAVCSIALYALSFSKVFRSSREGRTFASILCPVEGNQSTDPTSQSNCGISSTTLKGMYVLMLHKAWHENLSYSFSFCAFIDLIKVLDFFQCYMTAIWRK